MNTIEERDDETSLFRREMQNETLCRNLRRLMNHEPYEVGINSETLRRLMQRHNEAIALLREFLAIHPESNDLVRRTHSLVDNPE